MSASCAYLIKEVLPNYLSGLPIPDSFGSACKLSLRDWFALIPPSAILAGLTYTTYKAYCPKASPVSGVINKLVEKDNPKVVTVVDVEDLAEKCAFCRCWKSKNWPYCDGTHATHNQETSDNIGPLVINQ